MIPPAKNYFVYPDCVDGRKSFNGITAIIRGELQRDPGGGDVFIFVSRSRQSIKLLFWEHGGFVIYDKRMISRRAVINQSARKKAKFCK